MTTKLLKKGDEFYSLEEFLLMPESSFDLTRLWAAHITGLEWIKRFDLASKSWELYGTEPLMGEKVAVLVNGHGTTFPSLCSTELEHLPQRILKPYDDRFFALEREDERRSLLDKAFWWRDIVIL